MRFAFVLILILLMCASFANAQSIGVAPSIIDFGTMVREAVREKQISVFNPSGEELNYEISADNEFEGWLVFDEPAGVIKKHKNKQIIARLSVPKDAPNSEYVVPILISTISKERGRLVLSAGVVTTAKVEIVGKQVVDGEIYELTVNNTETNHILVIKVGILNNGTVSIAPKIKIDVLKNNKIIDSLIKTSAKTEPNKSSMNKIYWNTSDKETGDYFANVSVRLGGNTIKTKLLGFKIYPANYFERSVEFKSFRLLYQPKLGRALKFSAKIRNSGSIDVYPKLVLEIYKDGRLIDAAESANEIVAINEEKDFSAYFVPKEYGDYVAESKIDYGKEETEPKTLAFSVSEQNEITGNMVYDRLMGSGSYFLVLILLVLSSVLIIKKFRKKRILQQ